jgi:hypothetical protein
VKSTWRGGIAGGHTTGMEGGKRIVQADGCHGEDISKIAFSFYNAKGCGLLLYCEQTL